MRSGWSIGEKYKNKFWIIGHILILQHIILCVFTLDRVCVYECFRFWKQEEYKYKLWHNWFIGVWCWCCVFWCIWSESVCVSFVFSSMCEFKICGHTFGVFLAVSLCQCPDFFCSRSHMIHRRTYTVVFLCIIVP